MGRDSKHSVRPTGKTAVGFQYLLFGNSKNITCTRPWYSKLPLNK